MQVNLNMTNLPVGSLIGPTFNLIPTPAGPITPSTVTLTQLLNGVTVTVNHNTTQIRIESTGDCTNFVDVIFDPCTCDFGPIDVNVSCVPPNDSSLCFIISQEGIIYQFTIPASGTGIYNGRPYYYLSPLSGGLAIYWDGTQWVSTGRWDSTKAPDQTLTLNTPYPISTEDDWTDPVEGIFIIKSITDGICPTTTTTTTTQALVNTIYLRFTAI